MVELDSGHTLYVAKDPVVDYFSQYEGVVHS